MENRHFRNGDNIKSILKQFALEYKINELLLDYSLSSYKTFLLKDSIDTNARTLIDNAEINSHIDTTYKIIQSYTIEILKRQSSFYPILIQLQSNENDTTLKALIYTQRIPQTNNIEKLIKQTILNICAYRGIIIGLGWNNINPDIIDIASKLRSNESHPEYYAINISQLLEPKIKSLAVKLIISKSNKITILSHDSLLLNGGFFKVSEGEVLLDYTKPIYDSPWRDIYGNIYGIGKAYPIGIEAGYGIRVEERDNKILYIADTNGYVSIVGKVMLISNTVTLDNINSKNIINIQEQEIDSLVVKNDNLTKDIISSGLSLNIDKLKIIGNIGAVNIISKDLFINGQVHIKSNIETQKASILHFKGKLKAKNAEIRYCENSFIECDDLLINYVNGSKLYFSRGKISRIQSNNTLFIQESLVVGNVVGKNNEFILNPCLYGEAKEELISLKNKIFNLNKLKGIFLSGNKLQYEHTKNQFLYEQLKAKHTDLIDSDLYDWNKNILNKQMQRLENSSKLLNEYNALMESFDKNNTIINETIRKKLEKMFDIQIIFENKCMVDFYIRFINFYGVEHRFHINASANNAIKRVTLSQGKEVDSIKILAIKNDND
ncbi:hypothetical protein CCY99_05010 [Helicobacter sp. 16-1353]|uniref:hypothetical protein n=1 Tax=Helicobacter sp. 16-1353 TaxID=2004996 RepID=UPI000DCEE422|nr:hypothetical protein [Helicobacter sp. 16-1353]RAX54043.1 hypothetical protein CCY99_05010 [Helicobacter sp. 16-1353]